MDPESSLQRLKEPASIPSPDQIYTVHAVKSNFWHYPTSPSMCKSPHKTMIKPRNMSAQRARKERNCYENLDVDVSV
jgi:hypothetical protein